ncbi:hypothetical protein Glove_410g87 [Diversispora epigaea]|uniref:Uncharacterized protein n=1 Tax=Diversispora epigaea TaxID=1348612 RepID=A0A397H5Z5_9GLOM|nr:hypothetical protein Glove_410g87 [Diversispora epigaea]
MKTKADTYGLYQLVTYSSRALKTNSEEIDEEIEIINMEESNNLEDDFGNYLQE